MTPEFSPELQQELLDDFYAECDEQLSAIRGQLAALDLGFADPASLAATLEAIFRNVHSVKGNAAIVGLRQAETLAHAAEDYLRAATRSHVTVDEAGVATLMASIQRLEEVVSAHRHRQPLPAIDDLQADLAALLSAKAQAAGAAPSPLPAPPPLSGNRRTHRFIFVPTRELDQRGINIKSVRERLSAFGSIVRAIPVVRGAGGMSFEFTVAAAELPAEVASWTVDGLSMLQETSAEPLASASEPDPVAPSHDPASAFFVAPSHIVRVDLSRLDELMRIAGELVIQRSRLEDRIQQTQGDTNGLKEVNLALSRSLRDLRAAITRVRMVSIAEIFTRMPFVVRDLAHDLGKAVRLRIDGQDTRVDKFLVERLKEPLLHLVRNAFSHGVETAAERIAAGKPVEGTIWLSARSVGQYIEIQIKDDGQGINRARVAARAREANLPLPADLDDNALLGLICQPGFSTRDEADRAAGRGVGMAVVQAAVRELGGSLTLESEPGRGSTFTLRLPVTLSIVETLIVSINGQTCAVPQAFIEEIVEVAEADVRQIKGAEIVPYREGVLPIIRLQNLFPRQNGAGKGDAVLCVLVVRSERGHTGLVVNRVHTQREVVVQRMNDPLIQVPGISGATELGDGRPVLILDPLAFTHGAVRPIAAPDPATGRASA